MRPLPRYATVSAADPSSGLSRLVQVPVELQIAGGGEPVGLHPAGPDLAGLAAFTLDSRGRVASWPLAAIELFGLTAGAAAGRDVRDVPVGGPVARELVGPAAARLAGQPPAVTDSLLPPGEVLALAEDSPRFRAMADRGPVLFSHLDRESAERIARRPGGRELAIGYTSFLAMPLIARGAVVGCATFGRAPRGPAFGPAETAAAAELASRSAA